MTEVIYIYISNPNFSAFLKQVNYIHEPLLHYSLGRPWLCITHQSFITKHPGYAL